MFIYEMMQSIQQKTTPDFQFPNSFLLYKDTFNISTPVSFFYFCINLLKISQRELLEEHNNNSQENREIKSKIIELYIKSKNASNIICRFLNKCKKKTYKYYEYDYDLRFISLSNYDNIEIIEIIENNTIYKFISFSLSSWLYINNYMTVLTSTT